MNRRAFVTGLGAVLAAPRAAEAQPTRQIVFSFIRGVVMAIRLPSATRRDAMR